MNKINILCFLFIFCTTFVWAENENNTEVASVEKTVFGFQTGFLGVWVHNETRLANKVALRSEMGFNMAYVGGGIFGGNGLVMVPTFTVEPRWYYNLNKRLEQQKTIAKNSGNYATLQLSYIPDWFVVSKFENLSVPHQITIIPTWGLKRTALKHLTYEFAAGLGYGYVFNKNASFKFNSEVAINLLLRIGYSF